MLDHTDYCTEMLLRIQDIRIQAYKNMAEAPQSFQLCRSGLAPFLGPCLNPDAMSFLRLATANLHSSCRVASGYISNNVMVHKYASCALMDAIAKKDFVAKNMKAKTGFEPPSVESVQSAILVTRRYGYLRVKLRMGEPQNLSLDLLKTAR